MQICWTIQSTWKAARKGDIMPSHYVAFPSLFILNTADSLFYVCKNIKKIASTKYLSYFINLKYVQKI